MMLTLAGTTKLTADRTGVIVRDQGRRGQKAWVPNGFRLGAKGDKNHGISSVAPTKLLSFFSMLRVTAKTAKPLCVGSIPTRASKSSQQLSNQ
jgi:hypothetical protein